nr:uncharacterized protein LOC127332274 [Lolium perenne]
MPSFCVDRRRRHTAFPRRPPLPPSTPRPPASRAAATSTISYCCVERKRHRDTPFLRKPRRRNRRRDTPSSASHVDGIAAATSSDTSIACECLRHQISLVLHRGRAPPPPGRPRRASPARDAATNLAARCWQGGG